MANSAKMAKFRLNTRNIPAQGGVHVVGCDELRSTTQEGCVSGRLAATAPRRREPSRNGAPSSDFPFVIGTMLSVLLPSQEATSSPTSRTSCNEASSSRLRTRRRQHQDRHRDRRITPIIVNLDKLRSCDTLSQASFNIVHITRYDRFAVGSVTLCFYPLHQLAWTSDHRHRSGMHRAGLLGRASGVIIATLLAASGCARTGWQSSNSSKEACAQGKARRGAVMYRRGYSTTTVGLW